MRYVWAIFASIAIFMVFTIIKVFYSAIIGNYKEEHLNELSKGVYIALGVSEIIPFIIAIVLIRIVWKKITYKESEQISSNNRNETSIIKAVYNHTKDVASEVKPTINEYKEKHSSTNQSQQNSIKLNEDEIYEKVMIEIEEGKKVKSTWAKALSQSNGNKDKAESIYIKERVASLLKEKDKIENETINESSIDKMQRKLEDENKSFKLSPLLYGIILFIGLLIGLIVFLIIVETLNQKDTEYKQAISSNIYSKEDAISNIHFINSNTAYINGLNWFFPEKRMNWYAGKDYCENLNYSGINNWKLPSKNEFNKLYYFKKNEDRGIFEMNLPNGKYYDTGRELEQWHSKKIKFWTSFTHKDGTNNSAHLLSSESYGLYNRPSDDYLTESKNKEFDIICVSSK